MSFEKYVAEKLLESGVSTEELNHVLTGYRAEVATPVKQRTKPRGKQRARGSGSLYRRAGTNKWWCQYYVNGEVIQESTGFTDQDEAAKFLRRRLSAKDSGDIASGEGRKLTLENLVAALIKDKQLGIRRGAKTAARDQQRWNQHLAPVFGKMRAGDLKNKHLSAYQTARKAEGAENATVNRELAIVKAALNHARGNKGIELSVPKFPEALSERDNVREGFVPDDKVAALIEAAGRRGLWCRALVTTAVRYGFRKGELLNMRVRALEAGILRLEGRETKNKQGRVVALSQEVRHLLETCAYGKQSDAFLFTRGSLPGLPVRDFRKTWTSICEDAGLPATLVPHDLRRTAVRNMLRAGVPEEQAMRISDHKTRSMLTRYNILDEAALVDAARRIETFTAGLAKTTETTTAEDATKAPARPM